MKHQTIFFILLSISNLSLLAPPLRLPGAILLTLILPGWGWANLLWVNNRLLPRVVLSLGASFAITTLGTLSLHYLPGPLQLWHLLALLNILAIFPILVPNRASRSPALNKVEGAFHVSHFTASMRHSHVRTFAILLILAFLLRFTYLTYSEFQGDEALAMITAAEIIEGHNDTLFLRGKGPGEVLLPAAVWRLTGLVTEGAARIPFTIAGLGGILTFYLLAKAWFSRRVALYSAAFLAASGFMVGFSRIVQYQTIVVWMSALALWMAWQWRQSRQKRWAFVSGLFLGVGLLAHYDAILVIPAIGWLFVTRSKGAGGQVGRWAGEQVSRGDALPLSPAPLLPLSPAPLLPLSPAPLLAWLTGFLSSALLFYLPYFLDPQISRTGSYLEDRIGGGLLKNNLLDFLHFNSFYSSFYYVLVVGLLLVGFLAHSISSGQAWSLRGAKWGRRWAAPLTVIIVVGLALKPDLLDNCTAIPFGLVLLAAFLSPALNLPQQAALVWFAVPFMGYNFAVATPLTHIYTILPGWTLLAGWMAGQIRINRYILLAVNAILLTLSTFYLWNAFVRHNVEFLPHYPNSNPSIFYTPFSEPPETGFFGFAHKTGWKSVGALIEGGALAGDYGSNEEEDVTSWYTRHAPRACNPGAEFYFIVSGVIDQVPLPNELIAANYAAVGQVVQPNGNTLIIQQQKPATLDLGVLDEAALEYTFNQRATPAAFSRAPRWETSANANFGGQIKLIGYDLNTGRAYPGGRILLTLYWQPLVPMEESYKVFVHLDSEHKYAQADSLPVCARYPTNDWRPGQIIADQHALHLAPDTPPGAYPLVVGLYSPENGVRLDILDVAGNPAGVSLNLAEVEIGD